MALLGLGFSFGGKDAGLGSTLSSIGEGFKSVGKSALSLTGIQSVLDSLSFKRLDEFKAKMTTLGGQQINSSALNLTTGLEAQMQQMDASLRKTGMGFGVTGKGLATFSSQSRSLAMSLGIAEDAAANAVQAMSYLKDSPVTKAAFAKLGLRGAASLAKFGDALPGVNVEKFTYAIKQMTESMGLSTDDVTLLIAHAESYGKASGNVAEALNGVAEMQALIRDQRNIFGKSAEDARLFVTSTYQLGTAFEKVGYSGGLALSKGLAEKLNMTGEEWEKLVAGASQQVPGLIEALGMTGQNTDAIFQAMKKGPTEFIKVVMEQLGSLKNPADLDKALSFFSSHMQSVFDPELVKNLRRILSDEQQKAKFQAALTGAEIKKASADTLSQYAAGRRSTITAQEAYEKAHEAFKTRIANLGSFSSWGFVADARQSFKDFGDLLQDIKRDGGVGKSIVETIGDIQRVGAAGLFPKDMQAEMVVFGDVAENLLGPLQTLKQAGIDLVSPLGLAAGTTGFLFARFMVHWSKTKDAKKAFIRLEKEVETFITVTIPEKVRKGVTFLADAARSFLSEGLSVDPSTVEMKEIGGRIVAGIKDGLKAAGNFLSEAFQGFMKGFRGEDLDVSQPSMAIGGALGRIVKNAVEWFKTTVIPIAKDFWAGLTGTIVTTTGEDGATQQSMANRVGLWLNGAMIYVWEKLKGFASGFWSGFKRETLAEGVEGTTEGDLGAKIGGMLRTAFDAAIQYLKDYLAAWWKKVGEIWDNPDMSFSDKLSAIFTESLPLIIATALLAPGLITSVVGSLVGFLGSVASAAGGAAIDLGSKLISPMAERAGDKLGDFMFDRAMPSLGRMFGRLGTAFTGFGSQIGPWITQTAIPAIGSALSGLGAAILGFFKMTLWPALVGIWNGLVAAVGTVIGTLTAPVTLTIAAIVALFVGLYFALRKKGDDFELSMWRVWEAIRYAAEYSWGALKDALIATFKFMYVKGAVFIETLRDRFENIGLKIKDFFLDIIDSIQIKMLELLKHVTVPLAGLTSALGSAIAGLASAADTLGFSEKAAAFTRVATALKGVTPETVEAELNRQISLLTERGTERNAQLDASNRRLAEGVEAVAARVGAQAESMFGTGNNRDAARAGYAQRMQGHEAEARAREAKRAAEEAAAQRAEAKPVPAGPATPSIPTPDARVPPLAMAAPTVDLTRLVTATNNPEWASNLNKKLDDLITAIRALNTSSGGGRIAVTGSVR